VLGAPLFAGPEPAEFSFASGAWPAAIGLARVFVRMPLFVGAWANAPLTPDMKRAEQMLTARKEDELFRFLGGSDIEFLGARDIEFLGARDIEFLGARDIEFLGARDIERHVFAIVGARREQIRRKRVPMRWCRSQKPAKSATSVISVLAGYHPAGSR
jgi:hypothetical protein